MPGSATKQIRHFSNLIFEPTKEPASTAPLPGQPADRSPPQGFDHLVQFYESDTFLAERVSEFIGAGIEAGEGGIVIGTPAHNSAIAERLSQRGLDLAALSKAGQYFAFDAQNTLAQFMVNGWPDEQRFRQSIGRLLASAKNGQRRRMRAFGEMVALLWAEQKQEAAVQLEDFWNKLGETHSFSLLCAYPIDICGGAANGKAFGDICHAHSSVSPSENHAALNQTEAEGLRALALLEQKARSLEIEIEKRKGFEDRSRLFASIVEHSDDAIASKDLNGIITSWNAGAQRIFGYTPEEIVGRPVTILIPPELQHEEPGILARLRRGERIDHYETIRRRKDGTLVEVSLTVSPLKDDTGKIVGASKIARDISERKRAETIQQALYDLASTVNRTVALPEIYDAALGALCRCYNAQRAAILLYDGEGVMRFAAWRNLSEEYRRAVEGHSPWQRDDPSPQPVCIDDVSQSPLDDRLRAVVRNEGIQSLVFLPITYEGRLLGKFMIYYNAPRHFTREELRPAQTIVTQVAFAIERLRTGENLERMVNERTASLREAIAQLQEFSYSVSHDLRAPVRAM